MGRHDKAAGLPHKLRSGLWHLVDVNEALQSPSEPKLFAQAARDMERFGRRSSTSAPRGSSPRRGHQNWWDREFADLESPPASSRSPSPPSSGARQQHPESQYKPFRPPHNTSPYPRSPASLGRPPPSGPPDILHPPPTLGQTVTPANNWAPPTKHPEALRPADTPRYLARLLLNPNAEQFRPPIPSLDPHANEFQPQLLPYPFINQKERTPIPVPEPKRQSSAVQPSRIPRPTPKPATAQVSKKPVSKLPRPVRDMPNASSQRIPTRSKDRQSQVQASAGPSRPRTNSSRGNKRKDSPQLKADQLQVKTARPRPIPTGRPVSNTTRPNSNGNRQVNQRPSVKPVAAAPRPLTAIQPTRTEPQLEIIGIDDVLAPAANPSPQPSAPHRNTPEASRQHPEQPSTGHHERSPKRPSPNIPRAPQDRTSVPPPKAAISQCPQQPMQRPQTWHPDAAPALDYHNLGFVAPAPSTAAAPTGLGNAVLMATIWEKIAEWQRSYPQLAVEYPEDAWTALADHMAKQARSGANQFAPQPSDEDAERNEVRRPFSLRVSLLEPLGRGALRYANHVKKIKE